MKAFSRTKVAALLKAARKAEKALDLANDRCACGNPDGCGNCDKYRDARDRLRQARGLS